MNHRVISAVLVLALASMACGFSVNLPDTPVPGPDITNPIQVPIPKSEDIQLTISFGAGDLELAPGAQDQLVEGSATYNLRDLKPVIGSEDGNIEIKQGEYKFDEVVTLNDFKNNWNLKLGEAEMDLSIKAGAYNSSMELGGLALRSLSIEDGAADTEVAFGSTNPIEMSMLRYETGASSVKMSGLSNANFTTMAFKAGAGDYDLDFSGELQRDATISLDCGLSDLTIRIPKGVHAIITLEGGPKNVNASSGWGQEGDVYTQAGEGPTLTFFIDMGAGNLTITD